MDLDVESWAAVARHGPGAALAQSPLASWPAGVDLLARRGWPLDAALLWPLLALAPLPLALGAGLWLWLWAAGGAAAWLAGRWWGSPLAGLVAGVAWQASMADAAPSRVAAAALLPLALGGGVIALDRARWGPAALAGALVGLTGVCWGPAGAAAGLAGTLSACFALQARAWRAAWVMAAGGAAAVLAVIAWPLAWMMADPWLIPLTPQEPLRWPLIPVALAGGAVPALARDTPRRWALPAAVIAAGLLLATLPGLGLPDLLGGVLRVDGSRGLMILSELGLCLLAGGAALSRPARARPAALGLAALALVSGLAQRPRGVRPWPEVPRVEGPVAVTPLEAGYDPAVRAALGVPVLNPPDKDDRVGRWLLKQWPALADPASERGRAALRELGVAALVDLESGQVLPLE
jgi:hypothetical protein